ncbi:transcriptional regulator PpsR [Paracoccus spongiarum]|uniref:Transcriptional regulator PpsR n=1 Tax=Paracoccus spongiarum TaxID=3064387 RepID=A0ABT9JC48_9RHOB|nr:transcriptional regulator PpsR [Paracoccus sp. 2205BS29-5]MDP5307364.1 transcriptional regulator PpsR [Paracoccus sp. 2205BS29-5]
MTRQDHRRSWTKAGSLPQPANFATLIESACDLAVSLNEEMLVEGISVNGDAPSLGCLDHWVGRQFDSFLTDESRIKFSQRIADVMADPDLAPKAIELNHVDNATWEFPVRYTIHRGLDGRILLLGRDMQPIAEVQRRLLQEQLARERDYQKLRAEESFYRTVLEASTTPIMLVDARQGRIRDANAAAADLFGTSAQALSGGMFAQLFEGRRRDELTEALQAAAAPDQPAGVDVVVRRLGRMLRLMPSFFRASGDLYLLCRIEEADQQRKDQEHSSRALVQLFASSADAIVLTDARGVIRDANEAFLAMIDATEARQARGLSLAEFLARSGVDIKLILEAATKQDRLRSYGAQVVSRIGSRTSVDISAARLDNPRSDPGFGLIMRDVTRREQMATEGGMVLMGDDAMRQVMDLVGTTSLKELASATSNVVEKMCIETALQLTSNNRVAAAEMLGLSRQSLYVKLRKHGFIDDSEDR